MKKLSFVTALIAFIVAASLAAPAYSQDDDSSRNILKQGLLGAGVGAIAAGTSKGNAGQGALVGAGSMIIGSALLDSITGPSSSGSSRRSSRRSEPPPEEDYYYADEPEGYYVEEPAPRQSSTQTVLKQGLVGAGVGAIAAGTSGGDAGKGALIGAGTSVIGNALLDTLTAPPQERRRVYRRLPPSQQTQQVQQRQYTTSTSTQTASDPTAPAPGQKRVIKKYDETGKLVSEEEIYY